MSTWDFEPENYRVVDADSIVLRLDKYTTNTNSAYGDIEEIVQTLVDAHNNSEPDYAQA